MASHKEPYNDGQILEKFVTPEQSVVIDDFGSTTNSKRKRKTCQLDKSSPRKKRGSKSHIAESVPVNKETTSVDSPNIYLTNIPNIELSQTSDRASTSRGEDFYQFWDSSLEEEYKKLWLPARTDCVDLPLTSLPGCVTKMMSNSWFSTKVTSHQTKSSPKISWPSCRYSVVDGMENDDTKNPPKAVRKIRIYPHEHQKAIFRKIVGCTRRTYNKAIDIIVNKTLPFDTNDKWRAKETERRAASKDPSEYKETENPWWNKFYVRNFIALNNSSFVMENPYLAEVPKATRDAAVTEAFAAYKGNMQKLKTGQIQKFDLGFRSKKKEATKGWTFTICPNAARGNLLFSRTFKKFGRLPVALSQRKFLKDKYKHEIKIHKDKYGDYYMIIIDELDVKRFENQEASTPNSPRIISIDPGVRTRHALYSNTGFAMEVGSGDITRLCRLARHVDRCFGERCNIKTNNHRRRRLYLRKEKKLRKRAKNLVREITDKTIKFLVDNSDVVIIPPFQVKDMVNRRTSKLRKETRKQMLGWSHYAFRMRLITKARISGTKVLVASEHYTSKTCGNCGSIHTKLGSNKVFKCPTCNFIADRDINGARNILLRSIRRTNPRGDV